MSNHRHGWPLPRRLLTVIPLLALLAAGCATGSTSTPGAQSAPTASAAGASGGSLDVTDPGATPSASPSVSLSNLHYSRGHCYTWDQTVQATHADDVSCAATHLFEDVGGTDLGRDYPLGHPYPTEAGWDAINERTCGGLGVSFLGYPIDPYGRFSTGIIRPFAEGWATGERHIECGLSAQAMSARHTFVPFRGKVEGQPQQRRYTTGACLDDNQNETSCARRHLAVVAGMVPLSGDDAHPPARDAENAACSPPIAAFLHQPTLTAATLAGHPGARLGAGWLGGVPASWRAGSHQLTCLVQFWDSHDHPVAWTGPPTLG